LRHQVFLDGEQLYGVGSYWQQSRGDELKVRLELQIAGQDSRLLQVSDSRFQWLDRSLPAGRTVTRVDLRQLRAVLAAASTDEVRPGEATWLPAQTELAVNCGGLPRLLAALTESFSFLPPQAMRLVSAHGSEPSGVPFFAVVGHWKPEKLALLLESQESRAESQKHEGSVDSAHLVREHVPQEVLLLVDQADLFPYRIEYRPLETPAASTSGRAVPYQLSARPLVVLEFSNVVFDMPIPSGQFEYTPPNVDWVDQTAAVLERLRRERQDSIAIGTHLPRQVLKSH
jgi:hypothetical protein